MIELATYQPGDEFEVNPVVGIRGQKISGPYGIAVTGRDERGVLFCAGLVPHWQGVAEAWILTDERARRSPRFLKTLRDWIDFTMVSRGLWRVHAHIPEPLEESKRLMRHAGAFREASLEMFFGAGEDCALYAIVREDLCPYQ